MTTTSEVESVNSPEAQTGLTVLTDAGLIDDNPTDETIVVHAENGTVDDTAFQAQVQGITATLRGMDGIVIPGSVMNYYELSANPQTAEAAEGLVSPDRDALLIPATLVGTLDEATVNAPAYLEAPEGHPGTASRC